MYDKDSSRLTLRVAARRVRRHARRNTVSADYQNKKRRKKKSTTPRRHPPIPTSYAAVRGAVRHGDQAETSPLARPLGAGAPVSVSVQLSSTASSRAARAAAVWVFSLRTYTQRDRGHQQIHLALLFSHLLVTAVARFDAIILLLVPPFSRRYGMSLFHVGFAFLLIAVVVDVVVASTVLECKYSYVG